MPHFFPCLIAFIATIAGIWLLRPLAIRLGLVDSPEGRKQHEGHIPLIGGVAMFLGFLFALLTLPVSLINYRGFIAGCALLVFIGVLDDFHELSARARLVAQIVAALFMTAWAGVNIQHLGSLLFYHDILLNNWAIPFTIFAVVGLINSINMIDGLNGLAGGVSLIAFGFLIYLAHHAGLSVAVQILVLLFAATLAFLIFNFPIPGRVNALLFMGDAGSMLLGFGLAWFLVSLSQGAQAAASPVTMLWIMLLPLFDTMAVMMRRLRKRTSLFTSDREHLHHLLQCQGFSNMQVTLMLCVMSFIAGLIGVLGNHFHIADGVMFSGFVVAFIVYLGMLQWLRKKCISQEKT